MANKEVFEKKADVTLESEDEMSDLEVDEVDGLFDGLTASAE